MYYIFQNEKFLCQRVYALEILKDNAKVLSIDTA